MKSTRLNILTARKQRPVCAALALTGALAFPSMASADNGADECAASTLRGVYMFHASGFNIVNGAAVPKAIIETLVFDGAGNVSTPAVSISFNGLIVQPPQGNPGAYTVDEDCTGTLMFADGIKFDLQIRSDGKAINLLQTNPNTVMQGTAQKVLR